jgi:hypothetical protein
MKYTDKQILEFKMFCNKHDIKFNNMTEYRSAIAQYYIGE